MINATNAREMTDKAIAEKKARMISRANDIVAWVETIIVSTAKEGKNCIIFTSQDIHNIFDWETELALDEAISILKSNGYEVCEYADQNGAVYNVIW